MDPMELGKLVWGFIQNFGGALAPVTAGAAGGIGALHQRRRQRKQFRAIFNVPWPKNDAQRKATSAMVLQTYQVIEAQGFSALSQLAHLDFRAGPTVSEFMKQLTVIAKRSVLARHLLQKAGYRLGS